VKTGRLPFDVSGLMATAELAQEEPLKGDRPPAEF